MPLIRRIPKRGFGRQRKKSVYQIVNIESLKRIKEKEVISPEEMKNFGLIKDATSPVKILGDGELSKPVKIIAHAFSSSAMKKIKKAGGKAEIINKKKPETRNQ